MSINNQEILKNSTPCVDNSEKIAENQALLSTQGEMDSNSDENQQNIADFSISDSEIADTSGESTSQNDKKQATISFEEHINKDFNAFEAIFPNISKSSLLNDDNLKLFAEGKEHKQFTVVYAQYCNLIKSIGKMALKQEQMRKLSAEASVGGLSSSNTGNDAYFTKEQVLKMSQQEIKRNYEKIRASQASW